MGHDCRNGGATVKAVRSLLYFFVGFMLALVAGLAAAQTTGTYWTLNQNTQPRYSSWSEACGALGYVGAGTFAGYSPPVTGALYCYKYVNGPVIGPDYTLKHTVTCSANQTYDPATYSCRDDTPPPQECSTGTTDYGVFPKPATGENICKSDGGGSGCGETFTSVPEGDGYRWTGTGTGVCTTTEQPETCTESSANFLGYVGDKPFCADAGTTPTPDPGEGGGDGEDPEEGGDGSEGGCPDGQTWVPGTSGGAGSCVNGSGDGGGGDTGGGTGGSGGTGGTGTGGGDTGGGSGDGSGTGGGTGDGEGEGEEGEGEAPGYSWPVEFKFYEPKYDKTVGELVTEKMQQIGDAPVVQLIDKLTTGPGSGGSCPSWSFAFNLGAAGNYGSMNVAPPCWIWTAIKTIMIITALFAARRIVFGG